MHQSSWPPSDGRRRPPHDFRSYRGFVQQPCDNYQGPPFTGHPNQPHGIKPQISLQCHDRPPGPHHPNFEVQIISDSEKGMKLREKESVIKTLSFQPVDYKLLSTKYVLGVLFYEQWSEALETVVQLWEMKLDDFSPCFTPRVVFNVNVPSDKLELNDRLKKLFLYKLSCFKEGDLVEKWLKEFRIVVDEIKRVSNLLADLQKLRAFNELLAKKKRLEAGRDLILDRVQQFKNGITCIENYLKNGEELEEGACPVFQLSDGEFNWARICRLVMRECRRLDDGLPIYARRQEILKQIHSQQVTILIGETGSGKSTQLVQFLADSGICGPESIVCTQPRKLAAISLAERVNEESRGCFKDILVTCYPSYSSRQQFDHKVIFMTDHCLLQHCISDSQLSKISCIIVDEAHERSLNTDLILALIKNLLCQRPCLRLVIMSATADATQLADYFFGCKTLHVTGRCYPVDIRYAPSESERFSAANADSYVLDVLRMVNEISRTEKDGTILAFLTSQMEVEWACENFKSDSSVVLPLHGKLSYAEQYQVFQTYPGMRKVIFSTNIAETSLTIPGVKYVVDSGMVKESRFEPSTGMNVLKVCRICQSSANQRAGRAGRTEPGTCYRLYNETDFESMMPHQEPDICKVHLGIAILKILALGIKNVQEFDFIDAPSDKAIDMAVRNLINLGAITLKDDGYGLTAEGYEIVKLGIEPRLGKMILTSFRQRLGREGLVLAAVMANASSIFCRVGKLEDKLKSDCLKVQFCHPSGDLFTLLAVYKEWEAVPDQNKNSWCWKNSINAKSLKRCREAVTELEVCLENELNIIVPTYWYWEPQKATDHDKKLKSIILSSLPENVAMYSGCDQLGFEVALTKKHVQLHPSCSLLSFCQRPTWVVFGEIHSVSYESLVCVTAFDFEFLSTLSPPPQFNFLNMESERLEKRTLSGSGSVLLKRFCGKSNNNLHHLVSIVRALCTDERIGVEVDIDQNVVHLYASSLDMEKACGVVLEVLEYEKKLLLNECLEKWLYKSEGSTILPPLALFGAGAEIKHLELEKRCLTVDIFHSNMNALGNKELLVTLERFSSGHVCSIRKSGEGDKWGSVTFLTPDAAKKAAELKDFELCGGLLSVVPSRSIGCGDIKMMLFPSLRAKIQWPRRYSNGKAVVKCDQRDVTSMIEDFSNLKIRERFTSCRARMQDDSSVVITGLDPELSEDDIYKELYKKTTRRIQNLFLLRGKEADNPPLRICEEAIVREISPFMPRRNPQSNCIGVQVIEPKQRDYFMGAIITFDEDLYLPAARALQQIEGKVLPGFHSWQKIRCREFFQSSVSCPTPVYHAIQDQLRPLLERLQRETKRIQGETGAECKLVVENGSFFRVKIFASGTKRVAELRRPLEQLMKGKIVEHPDITPSIFQILFTRDGTLLLKSTQRETRTHIIFDRHKMVVRVFGSAEMIDRARQMLVEGLVALHDSKQLVIQLRSQVLPADMMKRVVQRFGPDLHGLKDLFPEAEFSLNVKRHSISISGTKDLKQRVEGIILEVAQSCRQQSPANDYDATCPICLCDLDDPYKLEGCCHEFCRSCLAEQLESAIRSHDSFPLGCTREGCGSPFFLADLRNLLHNDKLEELFRASLGAYVAASCGTYRFCPSPDCPSVYRVADPDGPSTPFVCGACLVETCTKCHLECHPWYMSCEKYREFKDDPDSSLEAWRRGKEHVKTCPCCGFTIEKIDGCNHIECKCGKHVCWVCLEFFNASDECYNHLGSVHQAIVGML